MMSTILWVAVGLIAGFVACKAGNRTSERALLHFVLGVVGAVVGGFLFNLVGPIGASRFSLWSMLAAAIGAAVVLGVRHALTGRGQVPTRDRSTTTEEATEALESLPSRRQSESYLTPGLP